MARLATFIDGGYLDILCDRHFGIRVDMKKLSDKMLSIVNDNCPEAVDLLRTHYYHCLPYQSNPPTNEEKTRFGNKRKFFDHLQRIPRFSVREGRLALRGYDNNGKPIFHAKDLISNLSNMAKVVQGLDDLEELVKKQQQKDNPNRGGVVTNKYSQ